MDSGKGDPLLHNSLPPSRASPVNYDQIEDQVDVILLDFAKSFDKVPHQRLLYKLSFYGIRGDTLKWIEAFLGHNCDADAESVQQDLLALKE